jgi:hypothetical protein
MLEHEVRDAPDVVPAIVIVLTQESWRRAAAVVLPEATRIIILRGAGIVVGSASLASLDEECD